MNAESIHYLESLFRLYAEGPEPTARFSFTETKKTNDTESIDKSKET
jgi:hypothetical protein